MQIGNSKLIANACARFIAAAEGLDRIIAPAASPSGRNHDLCELAGFLFLLRDVASCVDVRTPAYASVHGALSICALWRSLRRGNVSDITPLRCYIHLLGAYVSSILTSPAHSMIRATVLLAPPISSFLLALGFSSRPRLRSPPTFQTSDLLSLTCIDDSDIFLNHLGHLPARACGPYWRRLPSR